MNVNNNQTIEEYMRELEREHALSLDMITIEKELEIFPEALSIIKRNKAEYEALYLEKKKMLITLSNNMRKKGLNDKEISLHMSLLIENERIDDLLKNLNFARKYLESVERIQQNTVKKQIKHQEIGFVDIDKAKMVDIIELCERYNIKLKKDFALCPFHKERHASFKVYPQTNSFHCFGCLKSGSSIKLVMELFNEDFISAVKRINNGH
jgi:hypothetical protein